MRTRLILILALALGLLPTAGINAQPTVPPEAEAEEIRPTPARLSFLDGQVSFFRPGAEDWVRAQINTPLAPGDQLYSGFPGNLEIQIGSRAFVRGWANTQIGLENHEPDFLQFKVTVGHAAFDLRTIEPGLTLEVATPNAAFTIDRPGYYRVDVVGARTAFIARRGGRAIATPDDGASFDIAPSEEIVIEGDDRPNISSFSAPPLDNWDNWNYARTDRLLEAESARYVPSGVYGVSDLDRHGRWRVVPDYGPVWVPSGVPNGWAPYSSGTWIHDPYYGWTWVDTAPWGWAPYHYGRWVHAGGYWGWAPGPAVRRPVYAPALVAFYGDSHVQVSVGAGSPRMGWVALGWGEPCVPWWGRPGFIHRPWWGGWGGPRIVNKVVVHHTTVVRAEEIHVYRNAEVRNGIVAIHKDRFGRGRVPPERFDRVHANDLRPIHRGPEIRPTPAAYAPDRHRGFRPSEKNLRRPVVATRPPHSSPERGNHTPERKPDAPAVTTPEPRLVKAPKQPQPSEPLPRPPFGKSSIERRPEVVRGQPPLPSKSEGARRTEKPSIESRAPSNRQLEQPSRPPQRNQRAEAPERLRRVERGDNRPVPPPSTSQPLDMHRQQQRKLPGEPASQLSPNRVGKPPQQSIERGGKAEQRTERREESSAAPRKSSGGPVQSSKGQHPGNAALPPGSAQ
jgi:hypothetical protein